MWKLAGKPGGGGWAASLLPGGLRRGRDPALCPLGQRPHWRRDQEPGGKGWRYHSFICSCIHTSKLPLRLSHARTCQRLETQNRHVHVIPSTEDVLCHLIPQVRSPSGHCREIPGGQDRLLVAATLQVHLLPGVTRPPLDLGTHGAQGGASHSHLRALPSPGILSPAWGAHGQWLVKALTCRAVLD